MPPRTRFLTRLALPFVILLGPSVADAETSYVIDKLLVGVHEEKNLDSAIIKVLPTGTEVEVVERDGELAQIEDPEKTRGWVDAAYLTAEQPAQLRLAAVELEKAALEAQLAELRGAATGDGDGGPAAAQIQVLTKENTELKGKLSDERLRAGKLQTEVAALRAEMRNNSAPPDARIVELERNRDDLQRALDDAEGDIAELSARASLTATAALVPLVLREYSTVILGILVVVAVLGFAGGAYAVDLLSRRRHGGFRV